MTNQIQSTILVTGGAGFIGSNFVELALQNSYKVIVLDALTYAGHIENLTDLQLRENLEFIQGDICDKNTVADLLQKFRPRSVINFAAESHVDRSIANPSSFIDTNVLGVFTMLSESMTFYERLADEEKKHFRFLQISTDEVFGSLGSCGKFSEVTPYAPNSPYSASKAAGDHLARAWFHTYTFPVITTNCSNNYGPKQFPEKLIPHMINCALQERPLPVYGNGKNVRDWIHVLDHCRGLLNALENGRPGQTYCFGGNSERTNIDVVRRICTDLDLQRPRKNGKSYENLIEFVEDRKGHDWRYAIDDSKAQDQLNFKRQFTTFEDGLKNTIKWYLTHSEWTQKVLNKPGKT